MSEEIKVQPKVCPTCGRCPTCGHEPAQVAPFWYPAYPWPWPYRTSWYRAGDPIPLTIGDPPPGTITYGTAVVPNVASLTIGAPLSGQSGWTVTYVPKQ